MGDAPTREAAGSGLTSDAEVLRMARGIVSGIVRAESAKATHPVAYTQGTHNGFQAAMVKVLELMVEVGRSKQRQIEDLKARIDELERIATDPAPVAQPEHPDDTENAA